VPGGSVAAKAEFAASEPAATAAAAADCKRARLCITFPSHFMTCGQAFGACDSFRVTPTLRRQASSRRVLCAISPRPACWRFQYCGGGGAVCRATLPGLIVVATTAVRVVKMAGHAVVRVSGVRHRLVTAASAVYMARLMPTASMVGGAAVGVLGRCLDHMLVDVISVRMVEVSVM
jgi:hypothetical protein